MISALATVFLTLFTGLFCNIPCLTSHKVFTLLCYWFLSLKSIVNILKDTLGKGNENKMFYLLKCCAGNAAGIAGLNARSELFLKESTLQT